MWLMVSANVCEVPAHKSLSGPLCFLPPPTSLSGVCPPHEGGFSPCITDLLLSSLLINDLCFAYASVVSTTGARLVWACSPLWGLIYLVYHRLPKVSASYSSSRLAGRSSWYLMSSVMAVVQKGLGIRVCSRASNRHETTPRPMFYTTIISAVCRCRITLSTGSV